MSATRELAKFVAGLRYESLPFSVIYAAKQCLLDWLGNAVRGSQERAAVLLRSVINDAGHEATIFSVEKQKSSALNAAFLNGAASHTLDFDDLHNPSIVHISTVIIPAALAVAEAEHKTGRDLLVAITAAYEATARVGESVNPESYYFWHTTGTVGTIGAGIAAAKALSLDEVQTVHALGSAGTQASGLWEFVHEGAMSKPLHAGKACYGGVLAAYLAKSGFTAASDILCGDKGFCRAMVKEPHFEKLTAALGSVFKIEENSFKPYPCCKHSHAAIFAALELARENEFKVTDIHSVKIFVNSITDSLINNPIPQTVYGCKFSIQYCTACALITGSVGLEHFTTACMNDKSIRQLMEKMSVIKDEEIQNIYDENPKKLAVRLSISLNDGTILTKTVEYPKGDPENPLSWQESTDKFISLCEPVYGTTTTEKLLDLVENIEKKEDVALALEKIFPAL